MKLTHVTAVLHAQGKQHEIVARSADAGIELDWSAVFGMFYRAQYQAQVGHWNTRGRNFAQDHAFFGAQYEKLASTVDTVAEHIRTFDVELPEQLSALSQEPTTTPVADDVRYLVRYASALLVIIPKLRDISQAAEGLGDDASENLAQSLISDLKHAVWLTASHLPEDIRLNVLAQLRAARATPAVTGA